MLCEHLMGSSEDEDFEEEGKEVKESAPIEDGQRRKTLLYKCFSAPPLKYLLFYLIFTLIYLIFSLIYMIFSLIYMIFSLIYYMIFSHLFISHISHFTPHHTHSFFQKI
jgi:hypothetical protein